MNASVMVVEDDDSAREMMDIALSHAGFRVSPVASGEAALELLHRCEFSLVLLDVHMPRINGLAVLAAMGALRRRPPVLMVSANTQTETVMKASSLGCAGYLAKPFSPRDLVERSRWVLAQAKAGPTPLILH